MYSNKKDNFENELLKAEIAKADQLAKAVSATELDCLLIKPASS